MNKRKNDVKKGYSDAIGYPILEMFLLGVIAGMVFDDGMLGRIFMLCGAVFWVSVIVLIIRNPGVPKKSDILYIQVGLLVDSFLGSVMILPLYIFFYKYGYPLWLESLFFRFFGWLLE